MTRERNEQMREIIDLKVRNDLWFLDRTDSLRWLNAALRDRRRWEGGGEGRDSRRLPEIFRSRRLNSWLWRSSFATLSYRFVPMKKLEGRNCNRLEWRSINSTGVSTVSGRAINRLRWRWRDRREGAANSLRYCRRSIIDLPYTWWEESWEDCDSHRSVQVKRDQRANREVKKDDCEKHRECEEIEELAWQSMSPVL